MNAHLSQYLGSKTNRHPKKQWFLTYPQWPNSSREQIISDYDQYDYYIVCQEKHKDGNPHYHMIIKFVTPTTKSQILQIVQGKYPQDWKRVHIDPVRNIKAAIQYCHKEDTSAITAGSVDTRTKFQRWYYEKFYETFGITVAEHNAIHNQRILERIQKDCPHETLDWIKRNFEKIKKNYLV